MQQLPCKRHGFDTSSFITSFALRFLFFRLLSRLHTRCAVHPANTVGTFRVKTWKHDSKSWCDPGEEQSHLSSSFWRYSSTESYLALISAAISSIDAFSWSKETLSTPPGGSIMPGIIMGGMGGIPNILAAMFAAESCQSWKQRHRHRQRHRVWRRGKKRKGKKENLGRMQHENTTLHLQDCLDRCPCHRLRPCCPLHHLSFALSHDRRLLLRHYPSCRLNKGHGSFVFQATAGSSFTSTVWHES